jgi:hypothetical protein
MHNDGRITVKELGGDTRAIYYPPVPIFRLEAKIMIDDDLPVDAYPGRLGHEGTHLVASVYPIKLIDRLEWYKGFKMTYELFPDATTKTTSEKAEAFD